jgi:hypothetical protein
MYFSDSFRASRSAYRHLLISHATHWYYLILPRFRGVPSGNNGGVDK